MRRLIYSFLAAAIILFVSCNPDSDGEEEKCNFRDCTGFSWSFVDADTYENLVGLNKLIHPDSIVVTNSDNNTMYHSIKIWNDGWVTIEDFSPFQEIYCFNQCLLDSSFSLYYYINFGTVDIDTLEIHFPAQSEEYTSFFNGETGEVPEDRPPETGLGYSTFWFRKKTK